MNKPPAHFSESRYIPVAIKRYVSWRDGGVCVTAGCECTERLQFDHSPEWNLLDPKRHDAAHIWLRCKTHHSIKSRRNTMEAAKVKRVHAKDRGEYRKTKNPLRSRPFPKGGPKAKVQSRGFQKWTKS